MAADSSFLWLRPAAECEEYLDYACKKGVLITVYGLTLRSSSPLLDSHVQEALLHVFRMVPTLRMCFRRRGDILWVCDMNREEIDFQVTEKQDVVEVMEELLQYSFPTTEGPLWCACLLPAGTHVSCSRPDLADTFPYIRTLLLANHHGIADGTSNMFIMNVLLRTLENVMAGETVCNSCLGKLATWEETAGILKARKEELMKDPNLLQKLRKGMEEVLDEPKIITRVYGEDPKSDFKSRVVLRDLDKQATSKFISRCKQEGITVNSGIVAAFNVSFVDLACEGGLEQEFFHIHGAHSINARRYWAGDTTGSLGYHVIVMMPQEEVQTPAMWRDNFWSYARTVHKTMSQNIQEKDVVTFFVLSMTENDVQDYFAERPPPETDYGASNMGNLDHIIPKKAQQVHLTHLLRVTSCWNDPIHLLYHTLHGSFTLNLTYTSDIIRRQHAQALATNILQNMVTVAHM